MRSTWVLALTVSACFSAPAWAAPEKGSVEGRWDLLMVRSGWEPKDTTGQLVLERTGAGWKGTLTFDVVLAGRSHPLLDVVVKVASVSFRVQAYEQDLRFQGRLGKDGLSGKCTWKGGGDFPWTATRPGKAEDRFEKGLSASGFLPRGDAERLGLDGDALDALLRKASTSDTDALLVLRDGHVVAERYFGRSREPVHVMSVTKFVVAFAVALLLEEEKLPDLDAPLSGWFPDWSDGRKGRVVLRHLLTHTSGIAHGETAKALNAQKDKVAYVRGLDVVSDPGAKHDYNNEAVALLSGVLEKAAGRPVDDYLRDRLFAPLGVKDFAWDRDGSGRTITYAQLALSGRDLARLGQLVLDGGKVGSRAVLSEASIAALGSPATPASDSQGILWMLLRDGPGKEVVGAYHTGWLGQWIVVLPKAKVVGVRLRRWKGTDATDPEKELGGFAQALLATTR